MANRQDRTFPKDGNKDCCFLHQLAVAKMLLLPLL